MNTQMLNFLECGIKVFPGWVKTCDDYGVNKVSHVEFAWRLMPYNFSQVRNLLVYGHPRGMGGALREAKYDAR